MPVKRGLQVCNMISFSIFIEPLGTLISRSVSDELSFLVLRDDRGKTKSGDLIVKAPEVMMD